MAKNKKKGCLTSLLVFFALIAGIIIGGKVYLSSNIPDPVVYEKNDEISFYEKANIKEENYSFNMLDLLLGNVQASGNVEVDTAFTSEELTAFLQGHSSSDTGLDARENKPVLSLLGLQETVYASSFFGSDVLTNLNLQVIREDRLQFFCNISDDISQLYELLPSLAQYESIIKRGEGASIAMEMGIKYSEVNGFSISVESLYVNGIPVPQTFIDKHEEKISEVLNGMISDNELFYIESFKVTDNMIEFKGTIPESIQSIQ